MAARLECLLASFRRHLRAASKAPRTVESCSQSVRDFSRWLAEHGRPATLDGLTRHAMNKAPTEGIEIATAPDKPVPILTDSEITALLKTCAVGGTASGPLMTGRVLPGGSDRPAPPLGHRDRGRRALPAGERRRRTCPRREPRCADRVHGGNGTTAPRRASRPCTDPLPQHSPVRDCVATAVGARFAGARRRRHTASTIGHVRLLRRRVVGRPRSVGRSDAHPRSVTSESSNAPPARTAPGAPPQSLPMHPRGLSPKLPRRIAKSGPWAWPARCSRAECRVRVAERPPQR